MNKIFVKDGIWLIPMTSELYHMEKKNYIADPMMCEFPYIYKIDEAQRHFEDRINDINRIWFAIVLNATVIGDVYIKNIDLEKRTGVLSIALTQNCYKEKGYGTVIEKKILEYGVNQLGLLTIYADTVLRNTRSQHVLEKVGFKYINQDNYFKYYRYDKSVI